ncbi:acetyl-CoA synthetase-like protein [Paxillus ammoniavirescens]|nr:acetyl-CoA synthetase-like protein [Paxillus ammoniavirescens]
MGSLDPASTTLEFPPLDCSLLFPDLINFHMERNPTFPMFMYPNEMVPDTTTEISFLEFGRAAHRVAHILRPSRQGPDGQVVMVIANTDTILHHAVVTGISIAGLVPFPVSFMHSAAAIVNMMKKANCSRIVTLAHAHRTLINDICLESEGTQFTLDELPTLAHAFPKLGNEIAADPFDPYPPPAKRPDLHSPAIYVHSSGTTGFPKPIAHSYQFQIHWMTQPGILGYANVATRRIGSVAHRPVHAFALWSQLYSPLSHLTTTVVYPPRTWKDPHAQPIIATSDNVIECVRQTKCHCVIIIPALLEQTVTSEEAIEVLKNAELVCFAGGPLPAKVGDALWAAGVPLCTNYGGTEFGSPFAIANKKDIADGDWSLIRFGDNIEVRWAPQGDDTYECQVLSTENNRVAVENLPDVRGYATGDLFVKHPTKDMWKYIGRVDDVIFLASGEKIVPTPIENIIRSRLSPLVKAALIFGRERNQVGILIEPHPEHAIDVNDEKAVLEFKNKIWPVIEEANKTLPASSRIFKDMILITSSDKPMLQTAKRTAQRKGTLEAYEGEINAL